jgi:hypothetical protein
MKIEDLKFQIGKRYHGWEAETETEVKGQDYRISTSKNSRGFIVCTAMECTISENIVSFDMFGSKRTELAKVKANATEKTIRETHEAGLLQFIELIVKPAELAPEPYKIEIGQLIFTDGYGKGDKRAIYEVTDEKTFKTVYLDCSRLATDSRIRNINEKFGIGTYYNEGEKIDVSLLPDLIARTKNNLAIEADEREKANQEAHIKAEKKRVYLSQFKTADKRETTAIIKRHILGTFKTVSKVEVSSDSFSGGDSMHVKYFAPERVEEVEDFINSLQYGKFDGMNDIYNNHEDKAEIIIEDTILVQYKYTSANWEIGPLPEVKESENIKPVEVTAGKIQLIEYGAGLAVIGDTRPIKDKLKELGGRFNFRLTCGAGWVFKKSDLAKLTTALSN